MPPPPQLCKPKMSKNSKEQTNRIKDITAKRLPSFATLK